MFVLDNKSKEELQQLSVALYENKNFSKEAKAGENAMRKIMYDVLGVEEGATMRQIGTAYAQNKAKLFEVIDVAVDAVMPRVVRNEFDGLANFRNVNPGDSLVFRNPNHELFRVARIASGTQDVRRQTGIASSYTVTTEWYSAATYVEWEQFLTGQVDWPAFIEKVALSFEVYISQRIYDAFVQSYDGLRAQEHLRYTGAFDMGRLIELVEHVKASANSQSATVYTTASTLAKIAKDLDLSDNMRDEINRVGFLSLINGIQFVTFPNMYRAGTNEFLVQHDAFIIVPTGHKIVDVVFEGDTWTYDTPSEDNTGLQMDFKTQKKLGIHLNQSAVYGYYKIEA